MGGTNPDSAGAGWVRIQSDGTLHDVASDLVVVSRFVCECDAFPNDDTRY